MDKDKKLIEKIKRSNKRFDELKHMHKLDLVDLAKRHYRIYDASTCTKRDVMSDILEAEGLTY